MLIINNGLSNKAEPITKGVYMNQREAVFQATIKVLEEQGVQFEKGMDVSEHMSKSARASICAIITEGFKSGTVEFKDTPSNQAKLADESELKKYVSGLVNNWHRKDTRLNGGDQYQPKNPGSRTGNTDPEIKQLRLLMKSGQLTSEQATIVQARLDEKLAAMAAAKAKTEVDFSALPEDLKAKLGIQ
jgi:hypothetical protein